MRSPPGAAEAAPAPAGLVALLALASVTYAASFGWTFASHDFIRDLLAAGDIAHGDALPLRGPVINGMVHVGPQWFYVLAVPLLAGGGLLAATLWAGVLAALKVVAAAALGREIGGPRMAVLVAALSLLPGWSVVHQLQFTQVILLEGFVYATLLALLRLWRDAASATWAGAGLALGLAVQSHPVALFLLLPMAAVVLRRRRRWRRDAPWMIVGAILSVLPAAPMLWAEWREGFPALDALGAYAAAAQGAPRPWATLGVLEGLTWENARVMVALAGELGLGGVAVALFGVVAASAMAGLPGLLRAPRPRTLFVAVVGLALLCGAWTTTLRPTSTFYLALMAWPFVVLATALLVQGGDDRGAPPRTFLAITATLSLSLIGSAVVVQQGLSGRITLPLAGMLDVPEGTARATPVATMPVWATESLARDTCHADTVVLRGELAAFLDFYQGIPWRWTCVPTPRTALVATPDNGRVVERAVMTPAALRAIGWPATSWSAATSIIPARVLSDGPSVPQPTSGARHPHRDFEAAASQAFQRRVVTQPGEILAVYAPLFVFDGGAILEARIGGERIAPTVSTNGGALFEPPPAAAAGDTTWTLFLQGRRPEQIEIFTLRRPEAATGAPLSP